MITLIVINSDILNAQFKFNKYSFAASAGSYTPLSGASAFSWNTTTANDEEYSNPTNIGFTFNYDGTNFTQFQVSTNGFLRFGTGLLGATPTDDFNGTLRRILAPLWDDLAVSATATDITYKLSGITGTRVLTVEWQNVKWNKTAGLANAQFQILLYEADGHIEFQYGTMAAPTAGSASIGLVDNSVVTAAGLASGTFLSVNLGAPGNYHLSMGLPFRGIATAPVSGTLFTFTKVTAGAIAGGTYTVGGASPNYATLSEAAMDLSNRGISGAVTLNVRAGTYDDVFHLITVAGTSSSNTITLNPESGVVTLSPRNGSLSQTTGPTATSGDAVIRLDGIKYATIDNIKIIENDLNTTTTTKFEIGVLLANTALAGYTELLENLYGSRFNTLKNLEIDMKSGDVAPQIENGGALGIRFGTVSVSYDTVAANSYNTVQNCTIRNFHRSGIWMYGFYGSNPDRGNKITGCTLGPVSHNVANVDIRAIEMNAQRDLTIENTTISNIKFSGTATSQAIYGVWLNPANSTVDFNSGDIMINNVTANDLEINASTATTGLSVGISTNGVQSGTTLTVKNCKTYDISTVGGAGGSARAHGLLLVPGPYIGQSTNNGNAVCNVFNNYIYDIRAPKATTNPSVRAMDINPLNGSVNFNVYYNTIYLDSTVLPTVAAHYSAGIYWSNGANSFLDLRNNSVVNLQSAGTTWTGRVVGFQASANSNLGRLTPTSDNNLYYVGGIGNRGLSFDGTTLNTTITAHRTALATVGLGGPRDVNAVTELPTYTTTPTAINTLVATQIESGAMPVSGITTDYYGNLRNATKPDIGAEEGVFTQADLLGPIITYNVLTNTTSTGSPRVVSINSITDPSGVDVTTNQPRLYYKRPWHANAFNDNTNGTDGWKYVSSASAGSPFSFSIDYTKLYDGVRVIAAGDTIQYFVAAYDNAAAQNLNSNPTGFAGTYAVPTAFPTTPNEYFISTAYSGTVTVPGTFASLTNAGGLFQALDEGVLNGNLTVNITADLLAETGTYTLDQLSEEGAGAGTYTVTIKPDAAALRSIEGNMPIGIYLNGVDRLTVDGSFSGSGKYLRFRNYHPSWAVIDIENDCKNVTIKNCIVEGGALADGIIDIGSTFIGGTGNDFITIDNNDLRNRSDSTRFPGYGILAFGRAGSLTTHNDNVSIINNNIYNYWRADGTSVGIYIAEGNNGWTISGNSFYQTAARTHTAAFGHFAMLIAGSYNSGGFNLTNNYIGGSAPMCGGTPYTITSSATIANFAYLVRFISVGNDVASNINGNTFANIDWTTNQTAGAAVGAQTFDAILINSGYVNIHGNTFGSASGTGSIKLTTNGQQTGAAQLSQAFGFIDHRGSKCDSISFNTIGSIEFVNNMSTILTTSLTYASLIPIATSSSINTSMKINNNLVGSTSTANSINISGLNNRPALLRGINTTNIAPIRISDNVIANLTNVNLDDSTQLIALEQQGNGVGTITKNKLYNLSTGSASTSTFGALQGIANSGSSHGGADISFNEIYALSLTNTGAVSNTVTGIFSGNNFYLTIRNNKVYDLRNASTGVTATSPPMAVGIRVRAAGTDCQITNNFISLGYGQTTNTEFVGIQNSFSNNLGALTMFYNTVAIGGVAAAGALPSFGLLRGDNSSTTIATSYYYKNNIFHNTRTGGTGKHYAIGNQTTSPVSGINWNIKSNFNNLYSSNPATIGLWGTTDCDLSTWQTSSQTGKSASDFGPLTDSYSSSTLVNFVDAPNGDLHLTGASIGDANLSAQSLSAFGTDYDNQTRNAYWAYKGADEVTTSPLAVKLTLKVLVEGYYGNGGLQDEVDIILADSSTFAKSPVVSGQSSTAGVDFWMPKGVESRSWIIAKHRNHLETWSAYTVNFPGGVASFDFTSAAGKAYGDNQKLVSGKYCIFGGDIPVQDGLVDLTDEIAVINDANSFASGSKLPTDLNGDDATDLSDIIVVVNNANAFITVQKPEPKKIEVTKVRQEVKASIGNE
jgi:hypothetical protein